MTDSRRGLAECGGAAALFGTTGLLAKIAHDEHVSLVTLLTGRFLIAAAALWIIVLVTRRTLPSLKLAAAGLVLGATTFAAASALNFRAIDRMGPGLAALIGYCYPVLVTAGTVALGREDLTKRKVLALTIALSGVGLLVAGQGFGAIDSTGALCAFGGSAVYTVYLLVSSSLSHKVDALTFSALVATGAGAAFAAADLAQGGSGVTSTSALAVVVTLALIPTAFAISTFLRGVGRIGASRASIVAAVEPAVAVCLGVTLLGESLLPIQVVGAALVIAAIALLELKALRMPRRRRSMNPLAN